ncbi:hypothetical protein [Sulfuriferula plumbiphila]|uniref:hypothetical protein n=1 Tax=Sulfuriferula plumbiphila TaxID=171865 RepID=UPI0011BF5BC6|nr:hypothetical protein [Sulfuriferula plumbiphila]
MHSKIPACRDALEVIGLGERVDIIFDLTVNAQLRRDLRACPKETNKRHTVIAPEVVAHLLWALLR